MFILLITHDAHLAPSLHANKVMDALNDLYEWSVWDSVNAAFVAVVVLFGVFELVIIALFLLMRRHIEVGEVLNLLQGPHSGGCLGRRESEGRVVLICEAYQGHDGG